MAAEDPFRVLIRRDNAYDPTLTLRFNIADGMGSLAIRTPGRGEPQLSVHFEESGLDGEALRAARFVHVVHQQRQSYALSRLTADVVGRLAPDAWVELKPLLEYGFRYLVAPEDLSSAGALSPVQVQVTPSLPSSAPRSTASRTTLTTGTDSGRPRVTPRTDPGLPPSAESVITRPVPMEPSLAAAALDSLTREQAIGHLRTQLGLVEQLHQRLESAEKKLATSRAREKDLLGVLGRWQNADLE